MNTSHPTRPLPPPAFRHVPCLLLLTALAALNACETQPQRIAHQDRELIMDGFVEEPANTPDRRMTLTQFPVNRLIRHNTGDSVAYVLADPAVCHCIYVGNQQAFAAYSVARQLVILYPNDETRWNWRAWGLAPQGFVAGNTGFLSN